MTLALSEINLADPRTFAEHDLTGTWQHLRAEQPVYWHPETGHGPGFWVLTRHADIMRVYRDTENFTSEKGNVLDTLLRGGDSGAGKMLAVTDGPRHTALRRLMLKAFSPRSLRVIADRLRAVTDDLLAAAVAKGQCDFAADVAAYIPLATICDLLGVPEADRAQVLRLTKSALASDSLEHTAMDSWLAKNDILMYFAKLAKQRRGTPHDDVVSLLATAQIDGVDLTEDEIMLNCYSLILGGDETSRLSMIGAVQAFMDHPDQWLALRDGQVEVDSAVEEVLRWTTPTMHFGRAATNDVLMHGRQINAGDIVTLWQASADFDPEVFDQPEKFDLARSPNSHLAFGYGPHFCLGAYLGRVEINAMLTSLRAQVRDFQPDGEVHRIFSNFLSGIHSLPVRLLPV
jgi:cytochrome P450